jgi:hypothetical protein
MTINNANNKLVIAGATTIIAEPLLALLHTGGVGVIVGLALGGAAYVLAEDHLGTATDEGETSSLPAIDGAKLAAIGYRMLNGKSTRRGQGEEEEAYEGAQGGDADDFDGGYLNNDEFLFSQLLASGWRPSYKQIFLARLEDGTDIFVSVPDLVHIALAGSTRQGKTSIIRQLLLQLCYIGCTCILLDPHYTPYDVDIDEDWTPYTSYLRFDPLECKNFERMEKILRHTATTVLDGRKKLREASKSVGVPIFIIIDEYPAVVAERPKVQDHVAKLLREGAKYRIFLCVASQDFHVKTVSPQAGGAIRDNYKTVLYVGGDATTAKVLLDTPVSPDVESLLGKGPVMLRCAAMKKASFAQTSFTDNAAIYLLLGPSSYEPGEEETVVVPEEMGGMDKEEFADEPVKEVAVVAPIIADKGPKAADIDINVLCACWNGGANTVSKLEVLFKMSHGEAYKAYKRIKAQKQEVVEEAE